MNRKEAINKRHVIGAVCATCSWCVFCSSSSVYFLVVLFFSHCCVWFLVFYIILLQTRDRVVKFLFSFTQKSLHHYFCAGSQAAQILVL